MDKIETIHKKFKKSRKNVEKCYKIRYNIR